MDSSLCTRTLFMCNFKIVFVTQRKLIKGDPLEHLKKLISGEPDALLIREKDLEEDALYHFVRPLKAVADDYNVPLILRGHPQVAISLNINMLQLSFDEFAHFNRPRHFYKVGASIHHQDEAQKLNSLADYFIYGHIFESTCKPGLKPRGIDKLIEIVQSCTTPVLAIGGIQQHNIPLLLSTGASGACIMSDAMLTPSPQSYTAVLRKIIE